MFFAGMIQIRFPSYEVNAGARIRTLLKVVSEGTYAQDNEK